MIVGVEPLIDTLVTVAVSFFAMFGILIFSGICHYRAERKIRRLEAQLQYELHKQHEAANAD